MSAPSGRPDPGHWAGKRVAVTGGAGFVGTPLVAMLERVGAEVRVIRSAEHDLRDAAATRAAVEGHQVVIHLAATVGGIGYNRRNPGLLAHDNMLMACNVFEQSRLAGVETLTAACTVCAYPKFTPVPFREEELWNGYPEETNAPYGLAKKMMLVLSDSYREQYGFNSNVPMIVNLYGPNDNFDLEDSHVIPALLRKFHEARERGDDEVMLWGTGKASREFLYVDDAARALVLASRAAHHLRARQHRERPGDNDRRAGGDDSRGDRLRGPARLGPHEARRATGALPRRLEGPRAAWIRGRDGPRRGLEKDARKLRRDGAGRRAPGLGGTAWREPSASSV